MLINEVTAIQIIITEAAIKLHRQRTVRAKLILANGLNFSESSDTFISSHQNAFEMRLNKSLPER